MGRDTMRVLSVSRWSQRVLWESCVTHQVSSAPMLDPYLLLLALLSPTEFTSRASCRRDRATETDPKDLPPGTLFLFLLKPRTVANSISVPRLKAKQLEIWGILLLFFLLKAVCGSCSGLGSENCIHLGAVSTPIQWNSGSGRQLMLSLHTSLWGSDGRGRYL